LRHTRLALTLPARAQTGLADLHLHQFASLGFGGNWFEESYQGPFKNEKSESLGFVNKGIHGFQQIHEKWLREAHRKGLTLAVVPAVNNDFICFGFVKYSCEDMSSALRQVHAAVEFARKNSDWYEIALDPWHARRIIKAGKLAAILAIEVSELFPHKYGSWRDQLDYVYSLGVRSIIAVHEIDNRFAGAAPHMDVIKWLNLIKRGHFFKLDPTGMHNMRGLTDEGRELFTEFMSRNMLIDLAHLSRESWRGVAKLSASRGYPLFDSHSRFAAMVDEERRKEYREFIVDEEKLELIKSRRGVVGLRTSFDYAETFVPPAGSSLKAVPNDCDGSSKSLAQQVQYANSRGLPVTFGCDMNGFAGQTGPRFGKWACPNPKGSKRVERHSLRMRQAQLQKEGIGSLFDTEGAAHVDLLPDLVSDLKLVGANTTSIENSAEHVLRMWERAYGDTSDAARPFAKDCSFFAHKAKPQQAQQFKDLPIDLMVDADLNESAMKEKVATAEGEHLRPKAKEPKEGDERIV
jgi:microsomal dipeptidase-like Zn-dependent dipeptidase